MRILYQLFVWLYPKMAWLLGLYDSKARKWVSGRKNSFEQLAVFFGSNTRPVVWMHCASLGEFEQGRPLLEALRKKYPGHLLLLSFFSPSGYEIRKDYPGVDAVFYLPMDGPQHAKRFMNIVQPVLVFFVKYEFWYFYLNEIKQRKIPLLLVSGIFRSNQPFFTWYGSFHQQMLHCFTHLFVQNSASAKLLAGIGLQDRVTVSGDTRFDRVLSIAATKGSFPLVEDFCANRQVLVAGSTWTEDDEALDHFVHTHPQMRFIIAPHDIGEERLKECETLYQHTIRYSEYQQLWKEGKALPESTHVLLLDTMGFLSQLYQYATIGFVGGGFGDDGIHNILEAAVYGKPVVFGPVYDKYLEASELLDAGGAFAIGDALELEAKLAQLLQNPNECAQAAAAAAAYVTKGAGATARTIQYVQENRLLTN